MSSAKTKMAMEGGIVHKKNCEQKGLVQQKNNCILHAAVCKYRGLLLNQKEGATRAWAHLSSNSISTVAKGTE